MQKNTILAEPAWSLGIVVWTCAALVFPLHLGWVGAGMLALAGYVVVAAGLLLVADVIHDQGYYYRSWGELRVQSWLFLIGLAVPATLAFALGHLVAPADEAFEDDVCAIGGYAPTQSHGVQEADDSFDLTADCGSGPHRP